MRIPYDLKLLLTRSEVHRCNNQEAKSERKGRRIQPYSGVKTYSIQSYILIVSSISTSGRHFAVITTYYLHNQGVAIVMFRKPHPTSSKYLVISRCFSVISTPNTAILCTYFCLSVLFTTRSRNKIQNGIFSANGKPVFFVFNASDW